MFLSHALFFRSLWGVIFLTSDQLDQRRDNVAEVEAVDSKQERNETHHH